MLVLSVVTLCVTLTTLCVTLNNINLTFTIVMISLVSAEAAVALVCLFGILFGDPGVVKRNATNSLPLPPEVACILSNGESFASLMSNIQAVSYTHLTLPTICSV